MTGRELQRAYHLAAKFMQAAGVDYDSMEDCNHRTNSVDIVARKGFEEAACVRIVRKSGKRLMVQVA